MPHRPESAFWSHYGPDIIRLSNYLQGQDANPAKQFGLVRKYPRLVEIARLHGVYLPTAQAEWSCCFEEADRLKQPGVMILDDIVIRGTMLDACRRHFEEKHDCESVTTVSLARNIVQHDQRLRLDYCARELSGAETHRFCSEIVLAIQCLGKPYDVDHPELSFAVTGKIETILESFESLGDVYCVTSAYANEHGVGMWTVLPKPRTKDESSSIWMGESLRTSVLKWRLFYRASDKKLTVCPILVSHCDSKDVAGSWKFHGPAQSFNDILRSIRQMKSCDNLLAEFRAGVFFTEVLLGLQLIRSTQLTRHVVLEMDREDTSVVFGQELGAQVCSLVGQLQSEFVAEPQDRHAHRQFSFQEPNTRWSNPEIAELRKRIVSHAGAKFSARPTFTGKLAAIFETLQSTLEEDATDKLNRVTRPAEVADRLLFGFTPGELSDLVSELSQGSIQDSDLLSLAIDVADTNGVLVPKTARFEGEIGRYLAYGEDTRETCIPLLQAALAEAFGKFVPRFQPKENIFFQAIELEKALVFALAEFSTPSAVRAGYPLARALYCEGRCLHPKAKINLEATLHGHYLALDFDDDHNSKSFLTRWLLDERILVKTSKGFRPSSIVRETLISNVDAPAIGALAERIVLAHYLQAVVTQSSRYQALIPFLS